MNQKTLGLIAGLLLLIVIGASVHYMFRNLPNPQEQAVEEAPVVVQKTATTTPDAQQPTPQVVAKKIRVLSPNGGGVWQKRKQYVVKWDTTLSKDIKVTAVLVKTNSVIVDPYSVVPTKLQSFEMFVPSQFPQGLPKEGSVTYTVPDWIPSGTYQVLVWGGEGCSFTTTRQASRCSFDMSDGLFSIK